MTGTIRKRDLRRLYRQIRKQRKSELQGQQHSLGNPEIELPSYSLLKYALPKRQRRSISFLTNVWNILNRFRDWIAKKMYQQLPRSLKKIVKKIGRIEARVHKKLVCMQPRLRRKYGRLVYPEGLTVRTLKDKKNEFFSFIKHGDAEDEEVEYIEDCFSDMERPKFGYRMKVKLMENEPCEIDFENPTQSTCNRTAIANSRVDTGYYDKYHHAQSRQTGEGFSSAAPVDCRIEAFSCDSAPTTNAALPPQPTPQATPQPIQPIPQATPQEAQPIPQATPQAAQPIPQSTPVGTQAIRTELVQPAPADYDDYSSDINIPNNINGNFQRPVFNSRPLSSDGLPSDLETIPFQPAKPIYINAPAPPAPIYINPPNPVYAAPSTKSHNTGWQWN